MTVIRFLLLFSIVVFLIWPIRAHLTRASWTALVPRTAIVLWQAIALSIAIAIFAVCFELISKISTSTGPRRHLTDVSNNLAAPAPRSISPNQLFGFTAAIIIATLVLGAIVVRVVGLLRARAYHRTLLDLVAQDEGEIPGALILEHPQATAYSLPGRHPRVVISRGAVQALSRDELTAVLAHERAHSTGHHDLVLFPFETFALTLPGSRVLAEVTEDVRTLLEMAADDSALRECEPQTFVRALCALTPDGHSSRPLGSLKNSSSQRAERVLKPQGNARLVAVGSGLSSAAILALPVVAILITSGGR